MRRSVRKERTSFGTCENGATDCRSQRRRSTSLLETESLRRRSPKRRAEIRSHHELHRVKLRYLARRTVHRPDRRPARTQAHHRALSYRNHHAALRLANRVRRARTARSCGRPVRSLDRSAWKRLLRVARRRAALDGGVLVHHAVLYRWRIGCDSSCVLLAHRRLGSDRLAIESYDRVPFARGGFPAWVTDLI